MSTVTDNDLKELKDLIKEQNVKFDKFEQKIDKLDEKIDKFRENVNQQFMQVNVSLTKLEESQNGLTKRFEDGINGLSKRLENLEFIARSVIGGLILALLLGLAKLLFPNLLT
jgi:chromosome segregation ATPase